MNRTLHTEEDLSAGLLLILNQQPLIERPLLIAVDGRSGAGKTTLAGKLTQDLEKAGHSVTLLHLEDMYQGWQGLAAGVSQWQMCAESVKDGGPALWFGWDWENSSPTGPHALPVPPTQTAVARSLRASAPRSILLAEGVGANAAEVDLRIWLDMAASLRKERALARDGDTFAPHWQSWAEQEDELLSKHAKNYAHPDFVLERHQDAP